MNHNNNTVDNTIKNVNTQPESVQTYKTASIHENYWFQDLPGTLFNLDYLVKIMPTVDMTYPEKINTLVRLSIYIGVILALFYANFLFIYIPIITMLSTYILYLFRIEQLENTRTSQGTNLHPSMTMNNISQSSLNALTKKNMVGHDNENFKDILNIKHCNKPNINNPFMNPLLFDSRLRDSACDIIKPENQLQIEKEYNKYCIKDVSDIWNHNSGRRQFYTVANTTYPNNQGAFANWLYKKPATCKEGNGSQCVANLPFRINSSLNVPGFVQ